MSDLSRRLATLTHQSARQYPGGITAIAEILKVEDGRALSTIYQDLSKNMRQTPDGKMREPALKVSDMIRIMELTGDLAPLYAILAHFSLSASSFANATPNAPTLEAEMLQDYPALVHFHKAATAYRDGNIMSEALIAAHEASVSEINQSLTSAIDEARTGVRSVGKTDSGRLLNNISF